jgi:hypothetical protein
MTNNSNTQNWKEFNAIRSIAFFSNEKHEVIPSPKHKKKDIDDRDLPEILRGACYKCIPIANGQDHSGHSYLVVNISRNNAKRLFGKRGLPSFVFVEFNNDGSTHCEYLEKQNTDERYHYKENDFIVIEDSCQLETPSETGGMFKFVGEHIRFSAPLSVLIPIDDAIYSNICRLLRKLEKEMNDENVETILEFAINRVGFTPAMYRQAITRLLL